MNLNVKKFWKFPCFSNSQFFKETTINETLNISSFFIHDWSQYVCSDFIHGCYCKESWIRLFGFRLIPKEKWLHWPLLKHKHMNVPGSFCEHRICKEVLSSQKQNQSSTFAPGSLLQSVINRHMSTLTEKLRLHNENPKSPEHLPPLIQ